MDTAEPLEALREVKEDYEQGTERPLGSYLGLIVTYLTAAFTTGLWLRRRRTPLPTRADLADVALLGLATHRLSLLAAKDTVTSPLRAPFTRYKGTAGPAQVNEEVRGTGVQHAIGELVTCPYCTAQWIGSALTVGMAVAPRATRLVASTFAVVGVADFFHLAYGKLESGH